MGHRGVWDGLRSHWPCPEGPRLLHQLAGGRDLAHQRRDLVRDRRDRLPLEAPRTGPDEVDLQRRVELRVVGAVVAAAGLPALERGLQRRARGERRTTSGRRRGPGRGSRRCRGARRRRRCALRSSSSSASPASSPASSRTTPACSVMVSRIARCSGRTFSRPSAARSPSTSAPRLGQRGRGALLRLESRRVRGGRFADDPAVHEQLDERVPAEAVRAVQAARRLADRVEPLDAGAVVLGADPDAAHRVVRRRRDLDRRGGDVEHLQLQQGLVDARQPPHDRLARQVRDVEPARRRSACRALP